VWKNKECHKKNQIIINKYHIYKNQMVFGLSFYRLLTLSLPIYTYIKIKEAQKSPPKHDE
jgi:hypothetical protein